MAQNSSVHFSIQRLRDGLDLSLNRSGMMPNIRSGLRDGLSASDFFKKYECTVSVLWDHSHIIPKHRTHGMQFIPAITDYSGTVEYLHPDKCTKVSGRYYSNDYIDENPDGEFFYCENCGSLGLMDDMRVCEGDCLCGDCISEQAIFDNYRRTYFYSDNMIWSEHTDSYIHRDDATVCNRCGCVYRASFGDCPECEDEDANLIESYSYKPYPKFFGAGPYYFGLEIEVNKRDSFMDIYDHLEGTMRGITYLKHDGSLDDDLGVEIVTHPMTFEYIKNENCFTRLGDVCKGGIPGYGIHIHVSRDAFRSELHLQKIFNFFDKNDDFIQKIANRKSEQWASIDKKNGLMNIYDISRFAGRYRAINTLNENTIEFRIFQSTSRQSTIFSYIEFIHSLIEFSRYALLNSINLNSYLDYVQASKAIYSNLCDRLIGYNFLTLKNNK